MPLLPEEPVFLFLRHPRKHWEFGVSKEVLSLCLFLFSFLFSFSLSLSLSLSLCLESGFVTDVQP